jgi:DNA-binding response OmpR family regulator
MIFGMIVAYHNKMRLVTKILIVEDERDACKLISDILEEEGFLVDRSYKGESAIKKIKRKKYDLVIVDHKLPGISGLEFLEEANKITPKLRVMMISAYGNKDVKAKAKELGAVKFLDKPYYAKKLVRIVKKILTNKKDNMRLTAPRREFSPHSKSGI